MKLKNRAKVQSINIIDKIISLCDDEMIMILIEEEVGPDGEVGEYLLFDPETHQWADKSMIDGKGYDLISVCKSFKLRGDVMAFARENDSKFKRFMRTWNEWYENGYEAGILANKYAHELDFEYLSTGVNYVSESKMGIEYISDALSTCEGKGWACIADDVNGELLVYDMKGGKYTTNAILRAEDYDLDAVMKDKEAYEVAMRPCEGEEFKEFAVKWNALEKKGDEDEVYKTKNCAPIHGNFNESIDDDEEEDVSMGDGQLHVFKQNEQVYGKDYYIFILPNGDCYYCSETAPHGGESFYDGEVPYTTMNDMEDILDAKELVNKDEVPPKIYKIAQDLVDKCLDEY